MTRARDLADSADKDIAGTLTVDGLTVNSGAANTVALFQSTDSVASIYLVDGNTTGGSSASQGLITTGNNLAVRAVNNVIIETGTTDRLRVDNNGDISFYEDTGTTPKFFWDASAESLGIGTSSPTRDLHISTTNPHIRLTDTDASNSYSEFFGGSGILSIDADKGNNVAGSYIKFGVDGSERMRITSGGNVGIGTTSPASGLHILKGAADVLRLERDATNDWRIQLTNGAFAIRNATSDIETMRIDASGNVGIGTSSPASFFSGGNQLVIGDGSGAQGLTIHSESSNHGQILFADGTTGNEAYRGILRYDHVTDSMQIMTSGATERMRIDSSGNVGIAATPPTTSGYTNLTLGASTTGSQVRLYGATSGFFHRIINNNGDLSIQADADNVKASTNLTFSVDGSEAMRISGGNLLVGKTTTAIGTAGSRLISNGQIQATASGQEPYFANRLSSDGVLFDFRKDGSTVGNIGVTNTIGVRNTYIAGTLTGLSFANASMIPTNQSGAVADNSKDLGYGNGRFDDIYATNATIQTSDRNEKQDIAELSDAEQRVAVAAKGLMRKFRWRDAVEAKGDEARTHFGIIAQDLQAAFAAEALDAGRYAMFISSTWWEHDVEVPAVEAVAEVTETTTDEDGNEVVTVVTEAVEAKDAYTRTDTYDTQEEAPEGATERTRLGVRYSELLAFIIGAL